MLQAGTQLHDRYRVLRRIGRGGMGAVYEAVDTRLRNTVAVKQLEIAGAAADRAFEREAQLLAGLRHPVLPVVIDYFSAAHHAFLVMQYIEGEDLEHHLGRQQRPCERDEVIAWANALLDGLEYLHSRTPAIVHRDIKPANVKRTPAGDIVLLDFGLAKGRLDSDPTVSPDSGLYGFTLQYAPPEQIDGHRTDVRSDLFALGATLYHLATGSLPFEGRTGEEVLAKQVLESLSGERIRALHLSPQVHYFIEKMMQKEREIRFQDPQQLQTEVRAWLDARAAQRELEEQAKDRPRLGGAAAERRRRRRRF